MLLRRPYRLQYKRPWGAYTDKALRGSRGGSIDNIFSGYGEYIIHGGSSPSGLRDYTGKSPRPSSCMYLWIRDYKRRAGGRRVIYPSIYPSLEWPDQGRFFFWKCLELRQPELVFYSYSSVGLICWHNFKNNRSQFWRE